MPFEVFPGVGLGPFKLGTPISRVITYLQRKGTIFPSVDVVFDEKEPAEADIVLDLRSAGLRLHFEPRSQRLRLIHVYDFSRASFSYQNRTFSAPVQSGAEEGGARGSNGRSPAGPTLLQLHHTFGPAHPGSFDAVTNEYCMQYPGLRAVAHIPAKYAPTLRQRLSHGPVAPSGGIDPSMHTPGGPGLSAPEPQLPLEFPDGYRPVASRFMVLYQAAAHPSSSSSSTQAAVTRFAPPVPPPSSVLMELCPPPPQHAEDMYFEPVRVQLGRGLLFTRRQAWLWFGSSVQDVLTDLGAPSRSFIKEAGKANVHSSVAASSDKLQPAADVSAVSPSSPALPASCTGCAVPSFVSPSLEALVPRCRDFFFNYFGLGLDILFDGCTRLAKKFVLHTNVPGAADFNQYCKCNFSIAVESEDSLGDDEDDEEGATGTSDSGDCSGAESRHSAVPHSLESRRDSRSTPPQQSPRSTAVIGPDTKFTEIKQVMGPCGQPLVHERPKSDNPFGATLFYAYEGVVFEVLKNNYVSSVTLFRS